MEVRLNSLILNDGSGSRFDATVRVASREINFVPPSVNRPLPYPLIANNKTRYRVFAHPHNNPQQALPIHQHATYH
jgi:hypothetical protein